MLNFKEYKDKKEESIQELRVPSPTCRDTSAEVPHYE